VPECEFCDGEIVALRVERIEQYGVYCRRNASDPTSVLVLIPEISWERIPHPSLRVSVGETVDVLILRKAREHRYVGSMRLLDPCNPYAPFFSLAAGTHLRGTVDFRLEEHVWLRIDDFPNTEADAACSSERLAIGSEVLCAFRYLNDRDWRVEVELLPD
jgi:hypothetical protein